MYDSFQNYIRCFYLCLVYFIVGYMIYCINYNFNFNFIYE